MNFDEVEKIVNNRLCDTANTDKEAKKFAEKIVNKDKDKKHPKEDTFKDMTKLANAKNIGNAMLTKVRQEQKIENPEDFKKTYKKTTKKKSPKITKKSDKKAKK